MVSLEIRKFAPPEKTGSVSRALKRLDKSHAYFDTLLSRIAHCRRPNKAQSIVPFGEGGSKSLPRSTTPLSWQDFSELFAPIQSWREFQVSVLAHKFVPYVVSRTTDGLTWHGAANVPHDKPCLFISNHRDIILDGMFLSAIAIEEGWPSCCPIAGDNLYLWQEAQDFFDLAGVVKVFRNLSPFKMYEASALLSKHICRNLSEKKADSVSFWIAGGAGRSKDGTDPVKPTVLKMVSLAARKVPLSDFVNSVNIVPVTYSYRCDPNDRSKATERIAAQEGRTTKHLYSDLLAITRGIAGWKGQVHVEFGAPLTTSVHNHAELAAQIEHAIHSGYKLFPENLSAVETLKKPGLGALERARLELYANPVRLLAEAKNA